MRNLENYIDQKNSWGKFFNTPAITFPLSEADAKSVAGSIDSELSPENLHCDGEITAQQAHKKYVYLTTVARELEAYCNTNNLTAPTVYEL